jgi:hypothetical protein
VYKHCYIAASDVKLYLPFDPWVRSVAEVDERLADIKP